MTIKIVEMVYGDKHTYKIVEYGDLYDYKYYVRNEDGDRIAGSFSNVGAAIKWAEEKA